MKKDFIWWASWLFVPSIYTYQKLKLLLEIIFDKNER
jgi:hypothetical protein